MEKTKKEKKTNKEITAVWHIPASMH